MHIWKKLLYWNYRHTNPEKPHGLGLGADFGKLLNWHDPSLSGLWGNWPSKPRSGLSISNPWGWVMACEGPHSTGLWHRAEEWRKWSGAQDKPLLWVPISQDNTELECLKRILWNWSNWIDGETLSLVSVPICCTFRRVDVEPGAEAEVYCSPCAERILGGRGQFGNSRLACGSAGTILLSQAASLLHTPRVLTCREIWGIILQNSVSLTQQD